MFHFVYKRARLFLTNDAAVKPVEPLMSLPIVTRDIKIYFRSSPSPSNYRLYRLCLGTKYSVCGKNADVLSYSVLKMHIALSFYSM